jgi:hypothetical protein
MNPMVRHRFGPYGVSNCARSSGVKVRNGYGDKGDSRAA